MGEELPCQLPWRQLQGGDAPPHWPGSWYFSIGRHSLTRSSLIGSSCNLPSPLVGGDLGWHKVFRFRRWQISRFFFIACDQGEAPSASVDWEEGKGHGRGCTNVVMTLIILIIIVIITIIIINSRFAPFFEQKKFKNFQGLHSMF